MSDILFFVQQKTTAQKAITLFATKGLEGSMPARMTDLPLIGVPKSYLLSKSVFRDNIAAYIKAFATQSPAVSFNQNRYINFFPEVKFDESVIGIPTIKTKALGKGEEDSATFFGKFNFTRTQTGQVKLYVGVPSPAFMKEGVEFMLEETTQTERGITNILGFHALVKIVKVLKFVGHIHNQIQDDDTNAIGGFFPPAVKEDAMNLDGEDDDEDDYIDMMMARKINSKSSWSRSEETRKDFSADHTVSIGLAILVAPPVDDQNSVKVHGPTSECPFSSGIPIPYFHGSLIPDMKPLIEYFQRTFLPLFGNNLESAATKFQDFRKGCFSLDSTKKGMALTHMAKCLELAIDTGAQIYFCVEGEEYCGAVLGGSGFSILYKNRIYPTLEGDKFFEHLAAIKGHQAHVISLAKLLSDMTLKVVVDGREKVMVTPEELSTARRVYSEIKKRNVVSKGEDAEKKNKDVEELLEKLSYDRSYKSVTVDNLLTAVGCIIDPKKEVWDDTTPLYLPTCALHDSHSAFVLSHFGRFAPSFISGKGKVVPFPKTKDDSQDPALVVHPDFPTVKLMDYMAIHLKPVRAAVADMERVLKIKGVVAETGMKGRPVRANVTFGGDERKKLWYGLMDLTKDMKGDGPGSTKRKAVKDENAAAKKRRLDAAAERFLDTIW